MPLRELGAAAITLACTVGLVQAAPEPESEAGSSVTAVPRWEKGDRLSLREVQSSRRGTHGGRTKPSMRATSALELEVLEAGPEGYVVRWTSRRPEFSTRGIVTQPLLENLVKLSAGVSLELEINADGTPTGVRNTAEVRRKMKRICSSLRRELMGQGAPQAQVDALITQLAETYESEESILDQVARSASAFFLPLGWRFEPGVPIEYEAQIVSPAGTAPLASEGTLSLDSYDAKTGLAHVTWTQRVDRDRAGEAIRALVGEILGDDEMPSEVAAAINEVAIEDHAKYVIDTKRGWVVDMMHERSVRMPGAERIDRATIRRRS
jgi:hypothetical protein